MNQVIVVVPTYNERENVKLLVTGIQAILPEAKLLFVDDNSPDRTADVIRELQLNNPNLLLISRKSKLGLGTAYIEAFQKILQENLADIVITMDSDLSHPIDALPKMTELIDKNNLVIGSRYIHGGSIQNWPVHRKLLSYFANNYVRLLTRIPAQDLTSGFMAIRREGLGYLDLKAIHSEGYAFLIELKYWIHRNLGQIMEVPITFIERRQGKSKLSRKVILEAAMLPIRILLG